MADDELFDGNEQRLSLLGDAAVLCRDFRHALRQVGAGRFQLSIQSVFFGVVHGIRVGRHVDHDVVEQFEVGAIAAVDAVGLGLDHLEQ